MSSSAPQISVQSPLAALRMLRLHSQRLVSFGLIGVVGFIVDSSVLHLAILAGMGPYLGRIPSYLVAATTTWALNRRFTFADRRGGNAFAELARFLAANSLGGVLNYGTYVLLVSWSHFVHDMPVLGVAAGSLVGMTSNYVLSHRLVFRRPPSP